MSVRLIDGAEVAAAAVALCKSGKFETGQGTCALICMDQLGPVRNRPCRHALHVHGVLADKVLHAARDALSPTPAMIRGEAK